MVLVREIQIVASVTHYRRLFSLVVHPGLADLYLFQTVLVDPTLVGLLKVYL